MATKKVPYKKSEDKAVDVVASIDQAKLEATNEIADNIIDTMNMVFNLNKIEINDFYCAEYKRINGSDPLKAKDLLAYILHAIPYFKTYRIGLNTNSKGIITSVYLLDRESTIDVADEYLI